MTKDVGILILGLLVAVMPFLGFPASFERMFFIIAGLIISVLAFLIRGNLSHLHIPEKTDTYAQNSYQSSGQNTEEVDDHAEDETKR